MFCSQCGRQVPDGSRYCNFCGAPIAVNDLNPDEKPEQEHYQDYSAFDAPKGFETLPYNKHGYDRQTTNAQQTQVPLGGFTTQAPYGQGGYQNMQQPWTPDFATRPVRRRKKWLLPVIIGAVVLLLALIAVLLFTHKPEEEPGQTESTLNQRNLINWGYACKMGEDYYVFDRSEGLLKLKEENFDREAASAAEPEVIIPAPGEIQNYDIQDMIPVGKWLYFQVVTYYEDKSEFCYHAYDTEKGEDHELFTETGGFCFTLDLMSDKIYYCMDGDIYYIDTTVTPGEGKECRGDTGLRLGDDPTIAVCPMGFLISERGDKGLKLISFKNETLRTFDKLSDNMVDVFFVKDGQAFYRLTDADDPYTIYRLDILTGESSLFIKQSDLYDPSLVRMTYYEDWYYFGITFYDRNGELRHGILRVDKDGEAHSLTDLTKDAPDAEYPLLCMVIAGKYMITRMSLLPEAPLHVFTVPDLIKMQ